MCSIQILNMGALHSHGKVLLLLKLLKCLVVPDEKGAYLISPEGGRRQRHQK